VSFHAILGKLVFLVLGFIFFLVDTSLDFDEGIGNTLLSFLRMTRLEQNCG
jgi:hypothetical protein